MCQKSMGQISELNLKIITSIDLLNDKKMKNVKKPGNIL